MPFELVLVRVQTAKVWLLETRVLWEHSAAWMSSDDSSGEQDGRLGTMFLVLDVHGSRVAETTVAAARRVAKVVKRILIGFLFFLAGKKFVKTNVFVKRETPGEPPLGLAASPYHHEKGDVPSGFRWFKLVQESSATAIRGP